jgi:hypothetical protein
MNSPASDWWRLTGSPRQADRCAHVLGVWASYVPSRGVEVRATIRPGPASWRQNGCRSWSLWLAETSIRDHDLHERYILLDTNSSNRYIL